MLAGLAVPAAALGLVLRASLSSRGHVRKAVAKSRPTTGLPEIGALYPRSNSARHMCTAGVVDSPGANTLITAAHCVSGGGAGMVFAPEEHGGGAPYGRWRVTAVHLTLRWVKRQDPHDDVAFLTVAARRIHGMLTQIERVTGGYPLGSTAVSGERVTVIGYPAGTTNDPITCTAKTYFNREFPSFDCAGYVGGTSGSPWLRSHGARAGDRRRDRRAERRRLHRHYIEQPGDRRPRARGVPSRRRRRDWRHCAGARR